MPECSRDWSLPDCIRNFEPAKFGPLKAILVQEMAPKNISYFH
jgi:hypothetical protein